MSWDIELLTDEGSGSQDEPFGWWNYTSNMGPMVALALHDLIDPEPGEDLGSGWDSIHALHSLEGPAGAEWLHRLIVQLESDPARYEQLDPSNGWGSYVTFLQVLRDLRAAVPEQLCHWEIHS